MGSENQKFRKYLLHSLAENEMNELDLRIISDASLEADLQLAENNLMEDYLENALTAEEIKSFENDFLINDRRRKNLEFLRTMKTYAHAAVAKIPAGFKTETASFWQKISGLFGDYRVAALTFAAMILIGFGFFFFVTRMQVEPVSNEIAQLNKKDLSDLTELKGFSTVSLAEGNFRDIQTRIKLNRGSISEKVLIQLALPPGTGAKSVFDVALLRKDEQILDLKDVHSYSNQSGEEMRLLFTRNVMEKGDYRIELRKGGEPPIVYFFIVE